jgi:integrase
MRIFQKTYRTRNGTLSKTATWYTEVGGKTISLKTTTKREAEIRARRLLPTTSPDWVTAIRGSYRNKGQDLERLELSLKHLIPWWTGKSLSTASVCAYQTWRQAEGASTGSINRELAALRRGIRLAGGEWPKGVTFFKEATPRAGFFEPARLEAVVARLPLKHQRIVLFASITGWRLQEVLGRTWADVDFTERTIRIPKGQTKNGEGRVFPFTQQLEELLLAQRAAHVARRIRHDALWTHLDRPPRYPAIRDFRNAWNAATAGMTPRPLFHDLRRTAVRTLVRAGIPESIAMKLTGHLTPEVFRRYDIVSMGDLRWAAELLEKGK